MEAYFEINNDEIIDLIDDDFARLDTVDQIGCRVDDLEASADDLYQKANELSKKVNTQLHSLHLNSLTAYQGAQIIREMRRAKIHSHRIRRLL